MKIKKLVIVVAMMLLASFSIFAFAGCVDNGDNGGKDDDNNVNNDTTITFLEAQTKLDAMSTATQAKIAELMMGTSGFKLALTEKINKAEFPGGQPIDNLQFGFNANGKINISDPTKMVELSGDLSLPNSLISGGVGNMNVPFYSDSQYLYAKLGIGTEASIFGVDIASIFGGLMVGTGGGFGTENKGEISQMTEIVPNVPTFDALLGLVESIVTEKMMTDSVVCKATEEDGQQTLTFEINADKIKTLITAAKNNFITEFDKIAAAIKADPTLLGVANAKYKAIVEDIVALINSTNEIEVTFEEVVASFSSEIRESVSKAIDSCLKTMTKFNISVIITSKDNIFTGITQKVDIELTEPVEGDVVAGKIILNVESNCSIEFVKNITITAFTEAEKAKGKAQFDPDNMLAGGDITEMLLALITPVKPAPPMPIA